MPFSKILNWWTSTSLVLRIFIGLVVGAAMGLALPSWHAVGMLGQLFVGALKAIAPLLVFVLVMASVAQAGKGLGSRFRVVIAEYLASTFIAAMVAVTASFLFPVTLSLVDATEAAPTLSLADVFQHLIASLVANPVRVLAEANYIGILFWAIVMGLALKVVNHQPTIDVVNSISQMITLVVKWIIQMAPFGIMGLVFAAVSESGLEIFTTYGQLLALLVGSMLVCTLVFNPLISFSLLRRNPYPLLFTCLRSSGLSAFFTRSSAANIPINMALCQRLGLDKQFYSVSIPLGATINMNGAAVTISVMSLAVAHTLGIEVTVPSALVLCAVSTLGACGSSGVAGGSLLLIPMACSFFGIPVDMAMQAVGVGFIIGVVQDSVETALNSSADVFFTATADYHERRITAKN